jgi:hypothetical protein
MDPTEQTLFRFNAPTRDSEPDDYTMTTDLAPHYEDDRRTDERQHVWLDAERWSF